MLYLNKEALAFISILITLSAYIPYFYSIIKGSCKPNAVSWLIWSVILFIAFFAQYTSGAGYGSYPTLLVALICFSLSIIGLFFGKKDIKAIDYLSLGAAVLTLPLWYFTSSPLLSIIALVVIDAVGFLPMVQKTFLNPNEENILTFFILGFSNSLTAMAMEDQSIVNVIFPLYLAIANNLFVCYVLWRRKTLNKLINPA